MKNVKGIAIRLLLPGLLLDDLYFSGSFYFLSGFYSWIERTRYKIEIPGNNTRHFQKIILILYRSNAPSDNLNFSFGNSFDRFDVKRVFVF